jgi:hypothetical protein
VFDDLCSWYADTISHMCRTSHVCHWDTIKHKPVPTKAWPYENDADPIDQSGICDIVNHSAIFIKLESGKGKKCNCFRTCVSQFQTSRRLHSPSALHPHSCPRQHHKATATSRRDQRPISKARSKILYVLGPKWHFWWHLAAHFTNPTRTLRSRLNTCIPHWGPWHNVPSIIPQIQTLSSSRISYMYLCPISTCNVNLARTLIAISSIMDGRSGQPWFDIKQHLHTNVPTNI